jgi:hypothetical protein
MYFVRSIKTKTIILVIDCSKLFFEYTGHNCSISECSIVSFSYLLSFLQFKDFNEFLMALNVTSSKNLQKKLDLAFTMYDIDGNGKIDRREMKKIIKVVSLLNTKIPK